jgi:hypothetical protein
MKKSTQQICYARWYQDKETGKTMKRVGFQALQEELLVYWEFRHGSLSRRSTFTIE